MKSLIEQLIEKDIHISSEYYGPYDLATNWEIQTIVENQELFEGLYEQYPLVSLKTLDDYILYSLTRKFALMTGITDSIEQEAHKTVVTKLINEATSAVSGITNGDIIRFINSHIEEIFDSETIVPGIRQTTLDIIVNFSGGLSEETYKFLCDKYNYLLLDRFDVFEKVFEKYPYLFSEIFPTGALSEIEGFRLETVLDVFTHILRKDNSPLKDTVERVIPVMCSDAEKLAEEQDFRVQMINERTISRLETFLNVNKHPKALRIHTIHKKIEEQLKESFIDNGNVFSYSIPVPDMIDRYRKQEQWELRLLQITHSIKKDDDKFYFESRLSDVEKLPSSLMDLVSTNVPTDDYFTLSQQQMLSITLSVGEALLYGILSDRPLLSDYLSMLLSAMSYISEKLRCEDENLLDDMNIIKNMLSWIVSNLEKSPNLHQVAEK